MDRRYVVLHAVAALALAGLTTGCSGSRTSAKPASDVTVAAQPVPAAERPAVFDDAARQIQDGNTDEAEAGLRDWLADHPNDPRSGEAYYRIGLARQAQKDFKGARAHYDLAVQRAPSREINALAQFRRADCNYELRNFRVAAPQYRDVERSFCDVKAIAHDELLFKAGMAHKQIGAIGTADSYFDQVNELYALSPYAEQARVEHSKYGTVEEGAPRYYWLEVGRYQERERAEAEAEKLRAKGYRDVHITETIAWEKTYHCVNVGKYATRGEALRAQEDAQLVGMSAALKPAQLRIPFLK